MEAWVALVITTAGTIGGTGVGAIIALKGARRLSKEDREHQERAETLRAFRIYFGLVVQSVSELRQLPPVPEPNPIGDPIGDFINWIRGDAATQIATKGRIHQLFGDRPLDLAGKLGAAAVDLRLRELPADVRAAIDKTNDYIERLGEQRTDERIEEWQDIHRQLMNAGDQLKRWVGDPNVNININNSSLDAGNTHTKESPENGTK